MALGSTGSIPALFLTERLAGRIRQLSHAQGIDAEEAASRMVQAQKVMRFGEPEEIAAVVVFLAAGGGTSSTVRCWTWTAARPRGCDAIR